MITVMGWDKVKHALYYSLVPDLQGCWSSCWVGWQGRASPPAFPQLHHTHTTPHTGNQIINVQIKLIWEVISIHADGTCDIVEELGVREASSLADGGKQCRKGLHLLGPTVLQEDHQLTQSHIIGRWLRKCHLLREWNTVMHNIYM